MQCYGNDKSAHGTGEAASPVGEAVTGEGSETEMRKGKGGDGEGWFCSDCSEDFCTNKDSS